MKIVKRKIKDLIRAEYNPRKLTKIQEQDLKDSLTRFGLVDPILVNINAERENIIIGGHQRVKVWESLGNKEVDCIELDLTLDKEKELNVRLNKNTGGWDHDVLNEYFESIDLIEWGFTTDEVFSEEDLIEKSNPINEETEHPFAAELDSESNYVVLKFKKDIDWIQAKTILGLKTESSRRSNGKRWSSGIGRVLNGVDFINKLTGKA
mgnify:CR=1 FL=1